METNDTFDMLFWDDYNKDLDPRQSSHRDEADSIKELRTASASDLYPFYNHLEEHRVMEGRL